MWKEPYDRLRNIHDFYSSLPDDAPIPTSPSIKRDSSKLAALTGMSEDEISSMRQKYIDEVNKEYDEKWDEILAKDMAKSNLFSQKKEEK